MNPYPYGISADGKPIAWFAAEMDRDMCLDEMREFYGTEIAFDAISSNVTTNADGDPVHRGSDGKEAS